jgi:RNA polymerase sigma-70 factor (ECF subfamily)
MVCRRMVTDPVAIEDIFQDATLAAWLNLDYLRNPERFASWWCGIVLNHARRHVAARRVEETRVVTRWAPEPAAETSSGPEHQIEMAEVADRVRAAVAALPPSQRHAARRFYLQGLTYGEAAAELGISVNALKARLHQGRKALRRSLNDLDLKEAVVPVTDESRMAQGPEFVNTSTGFRSGAKP